MGLSPGTLASSGVPPYHFGRRRRRRHQRGSEGEYDDGQIQTLHEALSCVRQSSETAMAVVAATAEQDVSRGGCAS